MDSREFDDLIKNSLESFSQLPKKEVKKAVFGKLFYQNLWVFHKIKLIASILVVGGGSVLAYDYLADGKESDLNQIIVKENQNELILDDLNRYDDSEVAEYQNIEILDKKADKHVGDIHETQNIEQGHVSQNNNSVADQINNISNRFNNDLDEHLTNNDSDKEAKKTDKNIDKDSDSRLKHKDYDAHSDKEKIVESEIANEKLISNSGKPVLTPAVRGKAKILDKVNSLNIVALHTCAPFNEISDVPAPDFSDYANDHKTGFTFDAYFSPYNKSDVDNVLDPFYNDYWWDFYKEHEMEKSGIGAGVNISYNYKNFKLNSGLNFDQVYDYKPQYEYFTNYDSIYGIQNGNIVLLNVELISGLEIYGPIDSSGVAPVINTDTTVVFYVDPNDDNLLKEIAESSNRYNYMRIPITLGYEFSFKRASIEINAGVEYSRLMKANGVSYKNGYVDVGIRPVPYYYYEDMLATTYQNNMSSIKINNWNYVANAIVRVRLTRSLDLFSAVRFQYNKNNIMGDDYLLQKTYKKYGLNFGITYHLNPRLALKEMVTPIFK